MATHHVKRAGVHTPRTGAASPSPPHRLATVKAQPQLDLAESSKAQGVEAKDMIRKARRIVFRNQNVELLSVARSTGRHVRTTAMRLPKAIRQRGGASIGQIMGIAGRVGLDTDLHDCDCAALLARSAIKYLK